MGKKYLLPVPLFCLSLRSSLLALYRVPKVFSDSHLPPSFSVPTVSVPSPNRSSPPSSTPLPLRRSQAPMGAGGRG